MRPLRQVGDSCLLYSAAMLLDETPARLIKELGHDGKRQPWEGNTTMMNYHIEEIVDIALKRGLALIEISARPANRNVDNAPGILVWSPEKSDARFLDYITTYPSIIICYTPQGGKHAVACDMEKIYDPRGKILDYESFFRKYVVESAWIMMKVA